MHNKKISNLGFTITELLVTLSIILILVTLVSVGITSAKSKSRRIQCLHNCGQHSTGLISYVQDNGFYPQNISETMTALTSFLGEADGFTYTPNSVWKCPSAYRFAIKIPEIDRARGLNVDGIGYNGEGLGNPKQGHPLGFYTKIQNDELNPVMEGDISSPSNFLFTGDAVVGNDGQYIDHYLRLSRLKITDEETGINSLPDSTDRIRKRHNKSINVTFADGHGESKSLSILFVDSTDSSLAIWNRDHKPHRERLK